MSGKTATRRDSTYEKSILQTPATTTSQWRMNEALTDTQYTSPSGVSKQQLFAYPPESSDELDA